MPLVFLLAGVLCWHGFADAKPASQWVSDARAVEGGGFSLDEKVVITIDPGCSVVMTKGNSTIDVLALESGMGHIISICSTEDTAGSNPHYFTAGEFFAASAMRKYQSPFGYGKAHQFLACESFSGGCCDMYVVPVIPGEYEAFDDKCDNTTFPILVTGDASATLENPALPAYKPLPQRPAEVQNAISSSWPGWSEALTMEVVLVEDSCETGEGEGTGGAPVEGEEGEGAVVPPPPVEGEEGEGVVTPPPPVEGEEGEGQATRRRMLQDAEPKLRFMYSGGHSGVSSKLFEFAQGVPGLVEGEGTGPPAVEGEEGEGSRRSSRRLMAESPEGDKHVMAVDAGAHPIEMVVNKGYIIRFTLYQATGSYYMTAPEFFASSVVRKFQNPFAEMKFATYPTEYEIFKDVDGAYIDMYVVPTEAGTYNITSGSIDTARLNGAKIVVVQSESELSAPTDIKTTHLEAGACSEEDTSDSMRATLAPQAMFAGIAMLVMVLL